MLGINYRLLQHDDIEKYRKIRLECLADYPENFGTTYAEELHAGSSKFDKILATTNTNDFLLGAFLQETIVGICGFVQQPRIKTKHLGEIVQMYVSPSFAGKGIGSQLLKLAIDKAFENNDIDQLLLSVVYSNEKAVSTYKKLGFIQYGKLENYFKLADNSWTQLFMVLTKQDHKAVNKKSSH